MRVREGYGEGEGEGQLYWPIDGFAGPVQRKVIASKGKWFGASRS